MEAELEIKALKATVDSCMLLLDELGRNGTHYYISSDRITRAKLKRTRIVINDMLLDLEKKIDVWQ